MRCLMLCLVLSLTLFAPAAHAADFYVGAGATCDSTTLGGAVLLALLNGPGLDTIYVVRDQSYTGQYVYIDNHSVNIIGGVDSCGDPTVSGMTLLDGTGGLDRVVIEFNSDDGFEYVHLVGNLTIVGGEQGGIKSTGKAQVWVYDSVIRTNLGPGISIVGPDAYLRVDRESEISANFAQTNGGGIACSSGSMDIYGDILVNEIQGVSYGGGIYASDCEVDIFGSRIEGNLAVGRPGGGIWAENGSAVTIVSDGGPTRISGNTSSSGGGLGIDTGSTAEIFDAWITENTATAGGGLYVGGGGVLTMGRMNPHGACHDREHCSVLSGNSASTGGAIILAGVGGATISQTRIEDNILIDGLLDKDGAVAMLSAAGVGNLTLDTVLMARNDGPEQIFMGTSQKQVNLLSSTSVDNVNSEGGDQYFMRAEEAGATMLVRNSIVYGDSFRSGAVGTLDIVGLAVNDLSSSPGVGTDVYIVSDMGFADQAGGNYSLAADSVMVDFTALAPIGVTSDIRGDARGQVYDDGMNPYEYGAYEYGATFIDGFESGDTSAWSTTIGEAR